MFSNYPFRICQNIPNNISILMFLLRAHIDIYWYTFTSAYTCGKCYFPKQKYAQSMRINLNVVTKQMNETSAPSREHFFCLLTTEQHLSKKFEPIFCVAFEWSFFCKLWNQLEYFRIRNSHESPSSSLLKKRYDRQRMKLSIWMHQNSSKNLSNYINMWSLKLPWSSNKDK